MNNNHYMKKNLIIAYFFSEHDGVGSLRSIALVKFLQDKNVECDIVNKKNNKLFYLNIVKKIVFGNYDNIYVSCGPFKHLLLIAILCFLFNKKLVVDFRDAWSFNILTEYGKSIERKSLKYYVASLVEIFTYKVCSNFILCTDGIATKYSNLFHDSSKITVIHNGFDFSPKYEIRKIIPPLTFICIGKFAEYNREAATKTLKDIAKLRASMDIHITFVGSNLDENLKIVDKLFSPNEYEFLPRMPYHDAIKVADNFDVGLLLLKDESVDYGTKIFDYIGLGMPFYSHINPQSNFSLKFKDFLFDLNTLSSNFSITDIIEYSRNKQFEKFKGILY